MRAAAVLPWVDRGGPCGHEGRGAAVMDPAILTGREAIQHEGWRPGVQFTIRGRDYQVARSGGTSAPGWTSWFCWALRDGQALPREREIKVPDAAKVTILRWGKPAWLSWEEWAARDYADGYY